MSFTKPWPNSKSRIIPHTLADCYREILRTTSHCRRYCSAEESPKSWYKNVPCRLARVEQTGRHCHANTYKALGYYQKRPVPHSCLQVAKLSPPETDWEGKLVDVYVCSLLLPSSALISSKSLLIWLLSDLLELQYHFLVTWHMLTHDTGLEVYHVLQPLPGSKDGSLGSISPSPSLICTWGCLTGGRTSGANPVGKKASPNNSKHDTHGEAGKCVFWVLPPMHNTLAGRKWDRECYSE